MGTGTRCLTIDGSADSTWTPSGEEPSSQSSPRAEETSSPTRRYEKRWTGGTRPGEEAPSSRTRKRGRCSTGSDFGLRDEASCKRRIDGDSRGERKVVGRGREEREATKSIATDIQSGKFSIEDISDKTFFRYLQAPITELDLLIRTGGDHRISNFLLYHLAYTEIQFSETLWPDFTEVEFIKCLEAFSNTERRFGKRTI